MHKPDHFLQSFVRNLLKLLLLFQDWIFIFFDSQKRIGDMAASTIVVNQIPVSNNAPSKATPPARHVDTNSEVGMTEYLPALRAHLASIIDHPDDYHWKIRDVVTLLHAVDPEFLNELLIQKNIALERYLITENANNPDGRP